MEANKKLKGIYFVWGDEYYEPFPRSLADTFEHYLLFTRYDFSNDWLEKIIIECNLANEQEFVDQIVVIEQDYQKYCEQQANKRAKQARKKLNIHYAQCAKAGILPF